MKQKNQAAVELGRLGGKSGTKKQDEARAKNAKAARAKRWPKRPVKVRTNKTVDSLTAV